MDSIWTKSCVIGRHAQLQQTVSADVAVIGAGMAGILTADALQQEGLRVVVLEAGGIGTGQSKNTTAKITAQHGLLYQKLLEEQGEKKARQYAQANLLAVDQYHRLVQQRKIDCDLEEQSAYLYGKNCQQLAAEAQAAVRLGLSAEFLERPKGPIPCKGAVCLKEQAQFHPLKLIRALAEGLAIFENSPAVHLEDGRVFTPKGEVRAKKVVFACHYPFLNIPGFYFAKMYQERSYLVALKTAASFDGMWIGAEQPVYSLRRYQDLVLLGGSAHRTGENPGGGCYDALLLQARRWFPDYSLVAKWSAQDCMPPDHIPYIGPYSAAKPDWYVATGFQKWGMTSSMVAASILRDLICGRKNPYAEVFDPGRFNTSTLTTIALQTAQSAKGLGKRFLCNALLQAGDILPGQGGIVRIANEKVGVYKEEDGTLCLVKVQCPHLGCQLEWNPDEKSWDCPCHGSRFDRYGRLLDGPAQKEIKND